MDALFNILEFSSKCGFLIQNESLCPSIVMDRVPKTWVLEISCFMLITKNKIKKHFVLFTFLHFLKKPFFGSFQVVPNLSLTSFSTDGDMDDDGFYYAELNGKRGLVPSNYVSSLQDYPGKYI